MLHVFEHTIIDAVKLIPFLFLTYLAMEYLEHKAGEKMENAVRKAGRWGPLLGSLSGIVPQCGFSAAASNLYAGRVISLGSLLAIYLSTSDEMLPILLSEGAEWGLIARILLLKLAIGMLAGFCVDLLIKRPKQGQAGENPHYHIHDLCEKKGILRSAVSHTLRITFFILIITFSLNLLLHFGGEEILANVLTGHPLAGPFISGLVGLIPNCAGSIVVTQLYLEGALGFGAMLAGLLTSTGVGILVLCRVNHNRKENAGIIGLVFVIGVAAGILL